MTSLHIVQTSKPRVIERNRRLTDALASLGFELARRRGGLKQYIDDVHLGVMIENRMYTLVWNEDSYIMAQYDLCDEKEGKAIWLANIESFVFGSELSSRNWEVVRVD